MDGALQQPESAAHSPHSHIEKSLGLVDTYVAMGALWLQHISVTVQNLTETVILTFLLYEANVKDAKRKYICILCYNMVIPLKPYKEMYKSDFMILIGN